jgi:hypothetical protein
MRCFTTTKMFYDVMLGFLWCYDVPIIWDVAQQPRRFMMSFYVFMMLWCTYTSYDMLHNNQDVLWCYIRFFMMLWCTHHMRCRTTTKTFYDVMLCFYDAMMYTSYWMLHNNQDLPVSYIASPDKDLGLPWIKIDLWSRSTFELGKWQPLGPF